MAFRFSRRDFLKQAGGALAALALPPLPGERSHPQPRDLPLPPDDASSQAGQSLGRVTLPRIKLRAAPDRTAKITGYRVFDDLVTLFDAEEGPGMMNHNPVWFKTVDGYAYSSFIQPVSRKLNRPLLPSQVNKERPTLLQVTMPYTDAFRQPSTATQHAYRLYYATTHWAVAVEQDESKKSWYKLHNDRGAGHYYARAQHLRPFSAAELAPIAPGVPDKRIKVDLTEHTLTAYEGKTAVLTARVATGAVFDSSDGVDRDYRTPTGTFHVLRKRASRHMRGGTVGVDYFDLPGVPWVTYFTWEGVALHGTYWHHDYGRERSHGCVNLTPDQARWLYLWTEPVVPPGEEVLDAEVAAGTPIYVFQ